MKNFLRRLVLPIILILLIAGVGFGVYNFFAHPPGQSNNYRYYHPVIVTGQVTTNGNNVTRLFFNYTYTSLSHTYRFNPTNGTITPTNQSFYSVRLYSPGVYQSGYLCGNGQSFYGPQLYVDQTFLFNSNQYGVVMVLNWTINQCVAQSGHGI